MSLTLAAPAKINLTLEVLRRRDDGYHEVASVLQTIALADTLSLEQDEELTLQCNIPELSGAENSVLRAACLLREETACPRGARLRLRKRIPLGQGLGGHSTNEAVTLRGLNELWGLGLSAHELARLATKLSSDAGFFLHGGTALARGRGELVTPLPPLPQTWLVLLTPHIEVPAAKTKRLYSQLTPSQFTPGELSQRFAHHPPQGLAALEEAMFNVFEAVAFDSFPGLDRYRRHLIAAGASRVHLAGSGPALFALVPQRAQGEELLGHLEKAGLGGYLLSTAPPHAPLAQIQGEPCPHSEPS